MQMFLERLLRCSIAMSIISLVYMITMSLLSKRYSAKWLYYIWLVIVIGWLILLKPSFEKGLEEGKKGKAIETAKKRY